MSVILETTIGDLTIDLYCEERPNCCKNFLKLCKIKFYNFCLFHSIQKNSVAQTGDPTGTGRGGEAIYGRLYGDQAKSFPLEIKPRIKHKSRGQVSMINDGSGHHTSQFLITLSSEMDYLDEQQHTVFGEVVEGQETLEKLNEVYCDKEHRPYQDVRISHTIILDDPFPDPDGLEVPDRSPEPDMSVLKSDRIAAFEKLDDTEGMTAEEVEERMARREAESNEQLLRIVEDIPDVEHIAPNERSLFVCKLNPVTTDEDLEIIFSRFGPIVECAVVKDQKTCDSLQYAFIEFERREDCENAYFKMENVLIDDRRIHVDFSQSLHKELIEHRKQSKRPQKQQARNVSPKAPRYDFVFDDEEEDLDKGKKKKRREQSRSRDDERRHRRKSKKDQDSDNERDNRHQRRSSSGYRDRDNSAKRRDSPEYRDRYNRGKKRDSPEYRDSRGKGRSDNRGRRRDSPEHRDNRGKGHGSPDRSYNRGKVRDSPEHRDNRGKGRGSPDRSYNRGRRRDSPERNDNGGKRRDSPEHRDRDNRGKGRDCPEHRDNRGKGHGSPEHRDNRGKGRYSPDYRDSRGKRNDRLEYRRDNQHSRDDHKDHYSGHRNEAVVDKRKRKYRERSHSRDRQR